MTREQSQQTEVKDLDLILDEYMDWFLGVVRRVFFPGGEAHGAALEKPRSFATWARAAEESKAAESGILASLSGLNNDLMKCTQDMIHETENLMKTPAAADFDRLVMLYEEFTNSIRRISRDQGDGGSMHAVTGLRSRDMFYRDIRREMDRVARQGRAFSLALIRIDGYGKIRKGLSAAEQEACQNVVASAIRKIARSFDDSYHVEDDQFIMSLKQTDASGGMNAIRRLNEELVKINAIYKLPDGELRLTVSSCIGEPLPDDNVRQLVSAMKKDLEAETTPGSVLEHQEISPLQQLLKESKK